MRVRLGGNSMKLRGKDGYVKVCVGPKEVQENGFRRRGEEYLREQCHSEGRGGGQGKWISQTKCSGWENHKATSRPKKAPHFRNPRIPPTLFYLPHPAAIPTTRPLFAE